MERRLKGRQMEKYRGVKIRKKTEGKVWVWKGMEGSSGKRKRELKGKEKGMKCCISPWLGCVRVRTLRDMKITLGILMETDLDFTHAEVTEWGQ